MDRLTVRDAFVVIILALFTLLSGCSSTSQDGPPSYYVDESKIPNAVPKKEALSKYGNMSSYVVFGKRYHVMSQNKSKHYEEVGTASWYGTKFHKRYTSSGERYDMLAMTAAHKSLPLPTYVEVTNLKNHKQVIVKVNDRGPFESKRIIDLSYVAAKKLGMIGRGTALVDVRAITPGEAFERPELLAKNTKHIGSKNVYLQIGAFQNKQRAEQLQKRLIALLSSPVTVTHSPKKLYRVQIGPFKDRTTASRMHNKLKAIGFNSKTYHIEA